MAKTIDTYLSLSVTVCKKGGFFKPDVVVSGKIFWGRSDNPTASIGFATDTRALPVAKLSYFANGTPVSCTVLLRWKKSNLNPEYGYYYFVCPVTHKLCRKLYLRNGEFVSRYALNALYERQTQSKKRRTGIFRAIEYANAVDDLSDQKHRRITYKGRLTPYGRKLEYLNGMFSRYAKSALNQ